MCRMTSVTWCRARLYSLVVICDSESMQLHRLAWTIGATSLLLLGAYACGGDDDNNVDSETPDSGGTPDTGSNDTPDTGSDRPDTGSPTDAGDAGGDSGLGLLCTGNPLSPDGGITSTSQDGGLFTVTTGNFTYGPQYVDENGGQIIFTEVTDHVVTSVGSDGGSAGTTVINFFADETKNLNQSDYFGGYLYTVMSGAAGTGGGTLFRTPLDGGAPVPVGVWPTNQVASPNGIAIAKNGRAYMTDPAFLTTPTGNVTTGVWSMNLADGGLGTKIEAMNVPVGVALNNEQTRLYVSYQTKAVKFWTIDPATGEATAPTAFGLTPRFNPAGIAVDQGGNVWVAEYDGSTQRGAVEVFNASGTRLWATIFLPSNRATGVAFGGADRTKVFVTTEKGDGESEVFSFSTRCPGTL